MSNVQKALDTIKLAGAQKEIGGVGKLAERAGLTVDVGRRLANGSPKVVKSLMLLEAEAIKVLGDRAL